VRRIDRTCRARRPDAPSVAGAVLLAISALCGGACGSSGATHPATATTTASSVTAKPRSAEEARFIATADAVCRKFNGALESTKGTTVAGVLHNATIERGAIAELAKLGAPASLSADWKRMSAYRQTLLKQLLDLAKSLERGQTADAKTLAAEKLRVHRELSELGARDGFMDCRQVGIPLTKPLSAPSPSSSGTTKGLVGGP
jgi:hypothetical protein